MVQASFAISGAVVVLLTLYDIFSTTLSLGSGRPLGARLMLQVWSRLPRGAGPARGSAGAIVSMTTLMVWMGSLWLGWTLIFMAVPEAVVRTTTGDPADLAARIYFTGFVLFTLGLGDYRPDGPLWQILTAVCGANGFLAITMSATYLVPVVSAAAQKRAIASMIDALGQTPAGIVINGWHNGDLASFGTRLSSLSSRLAGTASSHLAYPILHTFGTPDAAHALPVQVARLYEAVLLIRPLCLGCAASGRGHDVHSARDARLLPRYRRWLIGER